MYRRAVFDDVGGFDVTVESLRRLRPLPARGEEISGSKAHEQVAEYRQHRANMSRDYALMLTNLVDGTA